MAVTSEERATAIRLLRVHARDGRLLAAELRERTESLAEAKSKDRILAQFADLPLPWPGEVEPGRVHGIAGLAFALYLPCVGAAVAVPAGGSNSLLGLSVAAGAAALIVLLMHVSQRQVIARHGKETAAVSVEPRDDERVGTTERAAAQRALHLHYAAGQLDFADYRRRLGDAPRLVTVGETAALFQDLPQPRPRRRHVTNVADPWGALSALHVLAWLPGLWLAIGAGTNLGQWHWLVVDVLLIAVLASRKRLRHR